jgi:hypothetical protein
MACLGIDRLQPNCSLQTASALFNLLLLSAVVVDYTRLMPKAEVGDFVVVVDTGAYTLSMYSRCACRTPGLQGGLLQSLSARRCTRLAAAGALGSVQLAALAHA